MIHPITTFGEAAFLDGRPRAVDVEAMSDGEVMRLSFDAFEALAARNPALGRDILLDLGRDPRRPGCAPASDQTPGGRADGPPIAFPNYTQIPQPPPGAVWQAIRAASIVARSSSRRC